MIRAGNLRHTIVLQARTGSTDAGGGKTGAWADASPEIWASVEPLDGSQALRAMQQGLVTPHRVRMRYRDGVSAEKRVRYGARHFLIRSVVDVDERHRELQLLCDEVIAP
jgi:SPP1 family predicted phage head-tail adaptor